MTCDTPYYKKPNGYVNHLPLPCGQCANCKINRVNQWVFRLKQEEKISTSAHFVTLTYNTKHVPITRNGFMNLDKTDYQKFLKRLRKKQPSKPRIKYYMCGEYGEENKRPHYHAIMFNVQNLEHLNEAWQLGDIHIGKVAGASIAYTMKYIDKGKTIPLHARDDRQKEFSLMSKGLGKNYLTPQIIKWHQDDITRNYVTTLDGHRIPLPRYYRDRIYSEQQQIEQRRIIVQVQQENYKEKEVKILKQYDGKIHVEDYIHMEKQQRQTQFINRRKIRN